MNRTETLVPSSAIVLIRILVGWVFFVEGVLKFMWPEQLGYGRFVTIGIPAAHFMAPLIGFIEIFCGAFVILGLFTRVAATLLLCDISVAILSTKIPILLGHPLWHFPVPANLRQTGILSMLHEARTDFSMLLGLTVLLITGPGTASLDFARLRRRRTAAPVSTTTTTTTGPDK
jgi:putative oxidoreductase